MAKYRVPFTGSVLVEAESELLARLAAGMWSASVYQLTNGVEIQQVRPEVEAAYVKMDDEKIEDVGAELAAKIEELDKRLDPKMRQIAKSLTNYFVGEQDSYIFFEQERDEKQT